MDKQTKDRFIELEKRISAVLHLVGHQKENLETLFEIVHLQGDLILESKKSQEE